MQPMSIKAHRVRAGLTQQELADRLGSDQGTISGYETGKIMPSGRRLQEIASELGCSADDIILVPQPAEVA